ncbi:MAG TPA: hypothetical protein VGG75_31265 [Trebonia sp.]
MPRQCLLPAAVSSLLGEFTVEVTPKEVRKDPGLLADVLPAGTRVYTTFLPATPFGDTVAAAAALADQGLRPVPHLAARSVASEAELDRMVGQLAAAGADELLVIGGSVGTPAGTITESMQVLRSGVLERHGIRRVGMAGHPEGNPDIGDRALAAAIEQKNAFAADTGTQM